MGMLSQILPLLCCAALAIPAGAAAPVRLRYRFVRQIPAAPPVLHVVLDMAGLEPGETEVILPSAWGNSTGLAAVIANLRAEPPGVLIETSDPAKRLLRGVSRGKARIAYDLIQDWDGPMRQSVRHRAHVEPAYVEINTSNALIHPGLEQSTPVDCRFEWEVPAGWSIATSFGAGTAQQRFRGVWDHVQNAVFVAGDFRLHRSRLGKGTLVFAIRGTWNAADEEIRSMITKVIRLERMFWKDEDFPYSLVTLVPFGPGQAGSGGGGFTNAFSLHTTPENLFSPGFSTLLAHEVFHTWNPYKLGRMPNPSESIYWFTEGFTTYYADRLLQRAGLRSLESYVQAVNRIIRDYFMSPAKNASMRELVERSRNDHAKGRISYERGALAALWLDWRIRQSTNTSLSLDTVMLDLFREASRRQDRFPALTSERVFQAASRYISPDDLARLRSYVETGATIEPPAEALGPCVSQEVVEMPSFELGMNREDLAEKSIVAGLKPGSAAGKSGLREGDRAIRTSIYWNDTSRPVQLTVQRGSATLKFEYKPHGPSLGLVPRYVVDKTRYERDPQSCQ